MVADLPIERFSCDNSSLYNPDIAIQLTTSLIDVSERHDGEIIYSLVDHILRKPTVNLGVLAAIESTLTQHDSELEESTSRWYMKSIKQLIARISYNIRSRYGTVPYLPSTVQILREPPLYSFEAVITPLTNLEWFEITGRHIVRLRHKFQKPSNFAAFEGSANGPILPEIAAYAGPQFDL